MIITGNKLKELALEVFPLDTVQVGFGSVDVSLGKWLEVESPPERSPHGFIRPAVELRGENGWEHARCTIDPVIGYDLRPGEFVLAATQESIVMPTNVTAQLIMRSRIARLGLEQMNACLVQPGFTGCLTLELKNMLQYHYIKLRPGVCVAQLVFHLHEEGEPNNSIFKHADGPVAIPARYERKP